jgi:hypothetical protein
MLRVTLVAAVAAVGLAAGPALAEEAAPATDAAAVKAFTNQLTWQANQKALIHALAGQGYIATSELTRAENGLVTGTAMKDGKPVTIGVKLAPRVPAESATN